MFNIGDEVVVVNNCETYTTYDAFATVAGAKHYNRCGRPVDGMKCKVIYRGFHGGEGFARVVLYLVEEITTGCQYIIGEKGLAYPKKKVELDQTLYIYYDTVHKTPIVSFFPKQGPTIKFLEIIELRKEYEV